MIKRYDLFNIYRPTLYSIDNYYASSNRTLRYTYPELSGYIPLGYLQRNVCKKAPIDETFCYSCYYKDPDTYSVRIGAPYFELSDSEINNKNSSIRSFDKLFTGDVVTCKNTIKIPIVKDSGDDISNYRYIKVSFGCIIGEESKILCILCRRIDKEFARCDIKESVSRYKTFTEIKNNVFFISYELKNDPVYKAIYKKLLPYIAYLESQDTEIIYLSSKKIKETVFINTSPKCEAKCQEDIENKTAELAEELATSFGYDISKEQEEKTEDTTIEN